MIKQIDTCRNTSTPHPLFASDNWHPFEEAIRDVYGLRSRFFAGELEGWSRPPPAFPPDLHYVQVCKIRQGKRLVRVEGRTVLGEADEVQIRLQTMGTGKVHTAYVERLNLTIRNSLSRFIRKTANASKSLRMHTAAIDLFQAWYNFIKPHKSLRQPLTHTTKKWRQRTPAMAEGLTDHIWNLEELFNFRVPIHQT